jgi:hypothetical protein
MFDAINYQTTHLQIAEYHQANSELNHNAHLQIAEYQANSELNHNAHLQIAESYQANSELNHSTHLQIAEYYQANSELNHNTHLYIAQSAYQANSELNHNAHLQIAVFTKHLIWIRKSNYRFLCLTQRLVRLWRLNRVIEYIIGVRT